MLVELSVTALIVISFTVCSIVVPDFLNTLWYDCLILGFQSLSLIFLTLALIRIQAMIKNHPVFKLSNKAMYLHWAFLAFGQLLCILFFIVQILIERNPDAVRDTNY